MTKYVMIALWVLLIGVFSVARSEPTLEETKEWTRKYRGSHKDICVYVNELSKTGSEDDAKATLWFLIKGGPDGFSKRQANETERALLLEAIDNSCKVYYESGTISPIVEWSTSPVFEPTDYRDRVGNAHVILIKTRLQSFLSKGLESDHRSYPVISEDMGCPLLEVDSSPLENHLQKLIRDQQSIIIRDTAIIEAQDELKREAQAVIAAYREDNERLEKVATEMAEHADREREGRIKAEYLLQRSATEERELRHAMIDRLCAAYPVEAVKKILKVIVPQLDLSSV